MDTSQVVKADESGCIQGLYGNKLQINHDWSNPSGGLSCPIPGSKPVMCLQMGLLMSYNYSLNTLIIDVQRQMSITVMVSQKHCWHSHAFHVAQGSGVWVRSAPSSCFPAA